MTTYPTDQGQGAGAIPVYIVGGGSGGGGTPPGATPKGFFQITNPSAAATLPSIPPTATSAVLTPEGGNFRWRADGTNPTASVGNALWATSSFTVSGAANMAAFKVILMTGSATGIVNVQYY